MIKIVDIKRRQYIKKLIENLDNTARFINKKIYPMFKHTYSNNMHLDESRMSDADIKKINLIKQLLYLKNHIYSLIDRLIDIKEFCAININDNTILKFMDKTAFKLYNDIFSVTNIVENKVHGTFSEKTFFTYIGNIRKYLNSLILLVEL